MKFFYHEFLNTLPLKNNKETTNNDSEGYNLVDKMIECQLISDNKKSMSNENLQFLIKNSNSSALTIFLNFLLSSTDQSRYLFFYVITDDYLLKKANKTELQKWAFEIHSTFILNCNSLMYIEVPKECLEEINSVLVSAESSKIEEVRLRHLFDNVRDFCRSYIKESLLPEFYHHQDLGISNLYGDENVLTCCDQLTQSDFVASLMAPYIQKFKDTLKDNSTNVKECKLILSCIVSYLRHFDIKRCGQFDLSEIDFFLHRKDGIFSRNKKNHERRKSIKIQDRQVLGGHHLILKCFLKPTKCSSCSQYLYGLGPQGYCCTYCGISFDEDCVCNNRIDSSLLICQHWTKKSKISEKLFVKSASSCSDGIRLSNTSLNNNQALRMADPYNVHRSKSEKWPRDKMSSLHDYIYRNTHSSENLPSHSSVSLPPCNRIMNEGPQCLANQIPQHFYDSSHSSVVSSFSSIQDATYCDFGDICTDADLLADDSDADVDSNDLPLIDTLMDSECAKELSAKQLRKKAVFLELYHAEKTHLKCLKIMMIMYRNRMRNFPCFTTEELYTIFPNLDELIEIHTEIKTAIRKRIDEYENQVNMPIADILLKYFSGDNGKRFRRECALFVGNQTAANRILKQKSYHPEFAHFLKMAELSPICKKLNLKDYLPTVMSRIVKYKLLFEQLLKSSDDAEERVLLTECLHAAEMLNVDINEAVRSSEVLDLMTKVKQNLYIEKSDFIGISTELSEGRFDLSSRKCIYSGTLKIVSHNSHECTYSLHKHKIKKVANEMQVDICPYMHINEFMLKKKAGIDQAALFLISHNKQRQFLIELRASSKKERDQWISYVQRCQENQTKHAFDQTENNNDVKLFAADSEVLKPTDSLTDLCITNDTECKTDEYLHSDGNANIDADMMADVAIDFEKLINMNNLAKETMLELYSSINNIENLKQLMDKLQDQIQTIGNELSTIKIAHSVCILLITSLSKST
ncbi:hypothetical protein GJ496_010252 [Pomphorhynchus laevis]|nr:hypothetical protein GJ496_010252 [Pomphorhynchus laevis]